MASAAISKLLTAQDFLALPEDGMDRWLIDGELREKPMTYRNRFHSYIMAALTAALKNWLDAAPAPGGEVLCGEAGVRLNHDPDTVVGVDVVYISAELAACQDEESTIIDGVPTLAVEILSPSDTVDEIHEKTGKYIAAGVALVWVIDPYDRTATIYRPGVKPTLVNESQELTGGTALPGFAMPLAKLFR